MTIQYVLRLSEKVHPKLPAVWMLGEILPLGTWSMIFANLVNRDHQKVICKHFNINHLVMGSWLHSLTYLRNLLLFLVAADGDLLREEDLKYRINALV